MKPRYKSKTHIIAAIITGLGVIETNAPMVRELLGEWYGLSYIAIGVAMAVLREMTREPVS